MPKIQKEDHRILVAKGRRERMEARLLEAVFELYAANAVAGPPTVEEVVLKAGVSRPTFYKYFRSVDAAISKRASALVDEMVLSLRKVVKEDLSSTAQFTISFKLFLMRAVQQPIWGVFVGRSNLLENDSALFEGINRHIDDAYASGDLTFENKQAALMLAVGTLRESLRMIGERQIVDPAFASDVTRQVLFGLGASAFRVDETVEKAESFIARIGPNAIEWLAPNDTD